jgi:hypothetical protein
MQIELYLCMKGAVSWNVTPYNVVHPNQIWGVTWCSIFIFHEVRVADFSEILLSNRLHGLLSQIEIFLVNTVRKWHYKFV